jgi:hypothetical protein
VTDGLRGLVVEAFEQARRSGKSEWWVMTAPVLKNRLLQITDRKFDQSSFGADTLTELLSLPELNSVVTVDASARPVRVTLRGRDHEDEARAETSVRPDLWKAILDYSSGTTWSWDEATRSVTEGGDLALPTLTEDEMDGWRAEFASQHRDDARPDGPLSKWLEGGLGAAALPLALRSAWYAFLKSKVVARLQQWFESQSLDPPPDLLRTKKKAGRSGPSDADLRSYVLRVVGQMTPEELRMVQLPAAAVARLGGPRP